ncbi:MAG: hypothetical protein P1P76_02485 [Anaerolineales bacterium]|nr:hypothetical protein [Anaerolineales bacterium]
MNGNLMEKWSHDPLEDFIQSLRQTARDLILGRDTTAAIVRFLIWGALVAFYWLALVVRFDFPGELPAAWVQALPPAVFLLMNIVATFFHPDVLLHLLPVLAGSLAGLFLGGIYISDLFELESIWIGMKYLLGALFGLSYPRLKIDRGDVETLHPSNPIKRIGGPGYIQTHLGYAAVFEDRDGKPRVYALSGVGDPTPAEGEDESRQRGRKQSTYFIEGFEQLRDVIDLRDRLVQVNEIPAETRDGVEVIARDAQMLFRVFTDVEQRSLDDPYPFSEESLRRLVYGRAVTRSGLPAPEEVLTRILEQEVQSFVSRYTLEDFLAMQPYGEERDSSSAQSQPGRTPVEQQFQITRRELTERFHTAELIGRLKDRGLALAWVGVGAWEIGAPGTARPEAYVGPEQTLLETWRNYQRLQLYRSPAFLQRQRTTRFQERITEIPRAWVQVWQSGDLPREHRCYELLTLLLRQLNSLRHSETPFASEHTETLRRIEQHLERLVQPDILGG